MALFGKRKTNPTVERVNRLINEAFEDTFQFDGEDTWMGASGSTAVFIRVIPESETNASVHVNGLVMRDVQITPNLCYDLLVNSRFRVGRWEVELDDDGSGKGAVLLGVDLLDIDGSLDLSEIATVISLIADTADEIDDELAAKYRGSTALTN